MIGQFVDVGVVPAVKTVRHALLYHVADLGGKTHRATRRTHHHPVAVADAARGGVRWVDLYAWPGIVRQQAGDIALLRMGEKFLSSAAGQDERIAFGQCRGRERTLQRFAIDWQAVMPGLAQFLRVEFDLARGRRKTAQTVQPIALQPGIIGRFDLGCAGCEYPFDSMATGSFVEQDSTLSAIH